MKCEIRVKVLLFAASRGIHTGHMQLEQKHRQIFTIQLHLLVYSCTYLLAKHCNTHVESPEVLGVQQISFSLISLLAWLQNVFPLGSDTNSTDWSPAVK